MIHEAKGEWQIEGLEPREINILPLYAAARWYNMRAQTIDISDIGHRELGSISVTDERYRNADLREPIMLVEMENPQGKRYRLVDGRHRLKRLINLNNQKARAFIFSREEFFKYCVR